MNIERKTYSSDDFAKTLNEIRQVIDYYRMEYKCIPEIIILSHNLMIGLRYMDFGCSTYQPLNNIRTIYGIECKESPVLSDLEYKVY